MLQQAENLCESLIPSSHQSASSLSLLLDDERNFFYRNFEQVEHDSHINFDQNCISLENLVSRNERSPSRPERLTKRQCLSLAVTLASSLLQLHATPWLPE